MAASSLVSCNSDPTPNWRYHVFLSFRGEDTRNNFTDHLYAALCRRGIITFRDDEELERGGVIQRELPKAIEESLSSIVILSQNYASSSWCLDELQKILHCRKTSDRWILPVFYGVDPSDVRCQRNNFAEAFKAHEERFGKSSVKVQSWKEALSEVASLSGYHSKNRLESELIDEIIAALWAKLEPNLPRFIDDGFIGIDTKIKEICQNLEIGSADVRFVGIWGMGGIGKTTLARIVFNKFRNDFDVSCCLENVREKSSAVGGLFGLQMELLTRLKIRDLEIDNLDHATATLRNLLRHRKVLILLDDVDDVEQLGYLAGKDWFGQGSRVIVTTRDMHLLESHDASFSKYLIEVELLNTNDSLELFCRKAFKGNCPREGYEELSEKLASYCQGLPLALIVLGSYFCGRDLSMWKDSFKKIRKHPPKDILDTLRISYEGLEDAEKTIFLDIASHFAEWPKDRVMQILKHCDFNYKIGIQILIERSLLRCHDHNKFEMHDLLQEMGKKIVIEKSNNEISKQSRLWSSRDIDEVLKKKKGTELIQSIVLKEDSYDGHWDPEAFSKMHKLRVLIVSHGLPLPFGLKSLPSSLKVIEWNGFPLKVLPTSSGLNKIVELKMHHSKIKKLWDGNQDFENLKFIDMSYSKDLIQTPNFFGAPNLRSLVLEGCSKLVEVHESVGQLKKLVILNLKDCINIKYLPSKLETNSLKDVILFGCSKLCRLPEIMNADKAMERLDLRGVAMQEVPSFVTRFQNLEFLSIGGCGRPKSNSWWKFWENSGSMELKLPPLSSFAMLRELNASFCDLVDGSIPNDLSCLSSLKELWLCGNNFVSLPPNCISKLPRLSDVRLDFCPKLQSLPLFPPSLEYINAKNCDVLEPLPDTKIWKLLSSDECYDWAPCLQTPRNEIPALFGNQKDVRLDYGYKSSITIDIPYCCRSSEQWRLDVCFLLEPLMPSVDLKGHRYIAFDYGFVASEAGAPVLKYKCWLVSEDYGLLNRSHVYILSHTNDENKMKKVVRGNHHQVKLYVWICTAMGRICEDIKISRCGWRVTCRNERVARASISDFENLPPDSKESRQIEVYHGKQSRDILEVQDAIVSDDEPNSEAEHHQAKVQLRKLE